MKTNNFLRPVLVFGFVITGIVLFVLNNLTPPDTSKIRVIACDVGQGDAILITQGQNQILVDGGPNSKVLDCMKNNIPISDRNIELVVLTHPQYDHYRGLLDVFERYDVEYFLASGLDSDAATFEQFEKLVSAENTHLVRPSRGLQIKIGDMDFKVLHPSINFQKSHSSNFSEDTQVLGIFDTNVDPNEFSVTGVLTYKNLDILLTGDLGPEESDQLVDSGQIQDIEILKVQHHGSKNGLSQNFLNASRPEMALISVGEDNRYGHPSPEIIKELEDSGVQIFRTDLMGEVVLVSDGESVWEE